MSSSAINQGVLQAKINNVQNAADSSAVYSAGAWSFKNASAVTSVTIDNSGNVGVGTTSPAYRLDVSGGHARIRGAQAMFWTNSDNTNFSAIYNSGATGAANGQMVFETNSIERLRIDSVGILTSLPTYNNGSASAANMVVNSSGAFLRSVSALKYKQDIRDLESININNFRPVRYKSKCAGDNQTVDHFGLIADEVDAAGIKELVSYSADGEVEGFQYDRLAVVLVKAIQELSAKVDAQAAEIEALKASAVPAPSEGA